MPYRRRYRRRKPRYFHRFSKGDSLAIKALKVAHNVRKLINVEYKYFDTTISGAVNTTGDITSLTAVSQGDGASNRDGESIKVVGLNLQMYANMHASATNTLLRVMLVQDKQADGTAPTFAELLEQVNVNGYRSVPNGKRFKVLYDAHSIFNPDGRQNRLFNKYIKFKNGIHIRYDGTSTSANTNSIYCMVLSSEATNTPTIGGYARIRYIDN